jgi:predicted nucleic acid-binding protein
MFLIDTNIFLEILLKQDKSKSCKAFLDNNIGAIHLSDFTLHSIGVILFRLKEEQIFHDFISDTLHKMDLLSLPKDKYTKIIETNEEIGIDFDDSYSIFFVNILI